MKSPYILLFGFFFVLFFIILISGDFRRTPMAYAGWHVALLAAAPLVVAGMMMFMLFRNKVWGAADLADYHRCVQLSGQRRYDESLALPSALARRTSVEKSHYSLVLNIQACAYYRTGRIDEALETWAAAEEQLKSRPELTDYSYIIHINMAEGWAVAEPKRARMRLPPAAHLNALMGILNSSGRA